MKTVEEFKEEIKILESRIEELDIEVENKDDIIKELETQLHDLGDKPKKVTYSITPLKTEESQDIYDILNKPLIITNFDRVLEFMLNYKQNINMKAQLLSEDITALRLSLIREEYDELREAIAKDDLIGIADALVDLLYVIYGAGAAYGINLDNCFYEVHRSNMSKLGEDGKPIFREDGKVLKGPNYSPPDLTNCINLKKY